MSSIQLGLGAENLQFIEQTKLSSWWGKDKVIPPQVRDLLKTNASLESTSFEKFRAKIFSVVVGAILPVALAVILGSGIYAFAQTQAGENLFSTLMNQIATLAKNAFATITSNNSNLAISAGGTAAAAFVLSRPAVYDAIGSFFGSLFGTILGNGLSALPKIGYNWCYNSYHFKERLQQIDENKAEAVQLLTETYNEIAQALTENINNATTAELQEACQKEGNFLEKDLITLKKIFSEKGLTESQFDDITLNLTKAINQAKIAGKNAN